MSTINQPKTMVECVEAYREAGNEWPAPREEIAAWIINNDLWEPTFESQLKECSRQMGDTLGKATSVDAAGHKYKKYLAAKSPWPSEDGSIKQKWLWDDVLECDRLHGLKAINHCRDAIIGDCRSLNHTAVAMNECNSNFIDEPINLCWDFTDDIAR